MRPESGQDLQRRSEDSWDMQKHFALTILLPLLLLYYLTLVFRHTGIDLEISNWFYAHTGTFDRDPESIWGFLYRYGPLPAWLLSIGGFLAFALGFFVERLRRYRKISLFFVVYMILGPGLIVNLAFKDNWGRPRPVQVEQFGGEMSYQPVWEKGAAGEGGSFPSGHASVAFLMMAPFFVFWAVGRNWVAFAFLGLGLGFGILMGMARIAQGGHFASDVIWSAGFIYLTGVVLYCVFRFDRGVWWES